MNPSIPHPKSGEKPKLTTTSKQQPPRGLTAQSDEMATTLAPPIAPLAPYDPPHMSGRLRLPTLQLHGRLPAFQPLYTPITGHNSPGSPASSPSSGTSSHRTRAPSHFPDSLWPPPGKANLPAPEPRRTYRGDESVGKNRVPGHGLKRSFDEIAPRGPLIPHQQSAMLPRPPQPHAAPIPLNPSTPRSGHSPTRVPVSNAPASHRPSLEISQDRFRLHLRQNPRAARAGPDGKDRRTIDPPPVLQLLLNNFDPTNDNDMADLKSHSWVVHAKLVSVQAPHEDISTLPSRSDSFKGEVTRLLLGTTVSSPFFCQDDPDPDRAPKHPSASESPPPSPTSRFIQKSSSKSDKPKDPYAYKTFPGAFFIFADLSIRKAGQYRLEFRLMKMDPTNLAPGSYVPTVSVAVSDVFNVVNAKDFDQVQPSTKLVRGLLDRGAGFPLKLKKGLREGQRRKPRTDDSEDDENAGDREEVEEEDDDR